MRETIHIFKVNDRVWADLKRPDGAKRIGSIKIDTEENCLKAIKKPGKVLPERVIALAERVLSQRDGPSTDDTFRNRIINAANALRGR